MMANYSSGEDSYPYNSDQDRLSDSESGSPMETATVTKRLRKPPPRYVENNACGGDLPTSVQNKFVKVACNQSGKARIVKISSLSTEEGTLGASDIKMLGQVLLQENGQYYAVTVISQIADKKSDLSEKKALSRKENEQLATNSHTKDSQAKRVNIQKKSKQVAQGKNKVALKTHTHEEAKREFLSDVSNFSKKRRLGSDDDDDDEQEDLEEVGVHVQKKSKKVEKKPRIDEQEEDLEEVDIHGRLSRIEKTMKKILSELRSQKGVKEEVDARYMHNGMDLLKIQASNAGAYARHLLDFMFSKTEQKNSLLQKSSKSSKPALDQERTSKLWACVEKKFPNQYNTKDLLLTLNQKCRDAVPDVVID